MLILYHLAPMTFNVKFQLIVALRFLFPIQKGALHWRVQGGHEIRLTINTVIWLDRLSSIVELVLVDFTTGTTGSSEERIEKLYFLFLFCN